MLFAVGAMGLIAIIGFYFGMLILKLLFAFPKFWIGVTVVTYCLYKAGMLSDPATNGAILAWIFMLGLPILAVIGLISLIKSAVE